MEKTLMKKTYRTTEKSGQSPIFSSLRRLSRLAAALVLVLAGLRAAAAQAAQDSGGTITTVSSCEALYEILYQTFGSYGIYTKDRLYTVTDGMEPAMEESMVTGTGGMLSSESVLSDGAEISYSETNLQEAGVDEGDLVKTDGACLYILRRKGSLEILSAEEGRMTAVSHIEVPMGQTLHELYLDGDRLSFLASERYTEMEETQDNVIASRSGTRTILYTYDISDRAQPVLAGTVTQDGSYCQSRKNGDHIYLFTRFSPILRETYEDSLILPKIGNREVRPEHIYLPETLNTSSYLVVSSVNLQDPAHTLDQKVVVSGASTFYASTENIYIANETWQEETIRTELLKLHYKDGQITGTAAGFLDGYLNDSFSLNESDGYLRTVTTSYDEDYTERNGLYILDQDLHLTGAIEDLAPGETIRSARFLKDTAYFVTFRQTDPLFSVDVSDPSNPQLLGELKITGFSDYLHFYNDHLLLGLGYEADPNTGITTGLKLSMFDISSPSQVTEVSKFVLGGVTWCEALENYKAILMDPSKNIFGFACDHRYLVFSYEEDRGFSCDFIYDFYIDAAEGSPLSDTRDVRGLYIDQVLYLVQSDVINSFRMDEDFGRIDRFRLT